MHHQTERILSDILKNLQDLRMLDLQFTLMENPGVGAKEYRESGQVLLRLPRLEHLRLRSMEGFSEVIIECLDDTGFPALRSLCLSPNALDTTAGIKLLTHLSRLENLELCIEATDTRQARLSEVFESIQHCSRLKDLKLFVKKGIQVMPLALVDLAKACPHLRTFGVEMPGEKM